MSNQAITCGRLYKDGIEHFTGVDPSKIPIFAAGFVSGQAEKVYLGACRAAMFRPSDQWHAMVLEAVENVVARYGLWYCVLHTERGREIWLCKDSATASDVFDLKAFKENDPQWHMARGRLCGIPENQIDPQFHERSGFGQKCD